MPPVPDPQPAHPSLVSCFPALARQTLTACLRSPACFHMRTGPKAIPHAPAWHSYSGTALLPSCRPKALRKGFHGSLKSERGCWPKDPSSISSRRCFHDIPPRTHAAIAAGIRGTWRKRRSSGSGLPGLHRFFPAHTGRKTPETLP